jgi:hypothetical protein
MLKRVFSQKVNLTFTSPGQYLAQNTFVVEKIFFKTRSITEFLHSAKVEKRQKRQCSTLISISDRQLTMFDI